MSDKATFLLILVITLSVLLVFRGHTISGFANRNNATKIYNMGTPDRVAKMQSAVEEEYDAPLAKRIQIRELLNDWCKKCSTRVNNACKTACGQFDPRLMHHMSDKQVNLKFQQWRGGLRHGRQTGTERRC